MTAWPASENPECCAAAGHPGVTHSPFLGGTFCLCGAVIHKGRPTTVDQHITCCGGQLDRFKEGGNG